MKRVIFILTIFFFGNLSALIISEVEANPLGSDSGREWIEFYSEEEVDLSDYYILNNDDGRINLSMVFIGYFVYPLRSQWLDNSEEKIFLYDEDDNLIDSTKVFDDSSNDNFTWQYCEDSWKFLELTRKDKCAENDELVEEDEVVEIEEDALENEIGDEPKIYESETKEKVLKNTLRNKIILNSKDIKSKSSKENLDKMNYFVGGLLFLGMIFFLVIQRKQKYNKNEFR